MWSSTVGRTWPQQAQATNQAMWCYQTTPSWQWNCSVTALFASPSLTLVGQRFRLCAILSHAGRLAVTALYFKTVEKRPEFCVRGPGSTRRSASGWRLCLRSSRGFAGSAFNTSEACQCARACAQRGHHEQCPFHGQNVGHFRHAKRWASFLRDIAHGMPVDKAGQKGKERDTLDAVRVHNRQRLSALRKSPGRRGSSGGGLRSSATPSRTFAAETDFRPDTELPVTPDPPALTSNQARLAVVQAVAGSGAGVR